MMNSMNNLKELITKHYGIEEFEEPIALQLAFNIEDDKILDALAFLKSQGFGQLSLLTCIDWIKDNKFQLVYILMNWETGIHLQVRTFLDRDKPVFKTCTHIYPGAQYYERDVHEFFGVEFHGNDDSFKHLFLELWEADRPLKKDFDPVKYSDEKYGNREYDVKFPSTIGGQDGGQ